MKKQRKNRIPKIEIENCCGSLLLLCCGLLGNGSSCSSFIYNDNCEGQVMIARLR